MSKRDRAVRSLSAIGAAVAALALAAPGAALAEPVSTPLPTPSGSAPANPADPNAGTDPSGTPTPTATIPPTTGAPGPGTAASPSAAPAPAAPANPNAPVDVAALPAIQDAPSWADVTAAAGDPTASAPLIEQLTARRLELERQLAQAEEAARAAGAAYQAAQADADQRRFEAEQLDLQAANARGRADESAAALSEMAIHLRARAGGLDPQIVTLFNAGPVDDPLSQTTTLNRFADNQAALYDAAIADEEALTVARADAAAALTQAEALEASAQQLLSAATAAQSALAAQRDQVAQTGGQLDVMLRILSDGRAPTQGDLAALLEAQAAAYQAGVEALAAAGFGDLGSLGAAVPLRNPRLTDGFGPRAAPAAGASSYHEGIDLVASGGDTYGQALYAVLPGTITYAGPMGSYGNMVEIDLGNGTRVRYAHIADGGIGVRIGEHVAAGQPIALAGSTGVSTGAHLHFEVRINGVAVDPMPWLRGLKVLS